MTKQPKTVPAVGELWCCVPLATSESLGLWADPDAIASGTSGFIPSEKRDIFLEITRSACYTDSTMNCSAVSLLVHHTPLRTKVTAHASAASAYRAACSIIANQLSSGFFDEAFHNQDKVRLAADLLAGNLLAAAVEAWNDVLVELSGGRETLSVQHHDLLQ